MSKENEAKASPGPVRPSAGTPPFSEGPDDRVEASGREQIRRKLKGEVYGPRASEVIDALLAELEQAERERDLTLIENSRLESRLEKVGRERDDAIARRSEMEILGRKRILALSLAEARLAKVPALVEALRKFLSEFPYGTAAELQEALAAWEEKGAK